MSKRISIKEIKIFKTNRSSNYTRTKTEGIMILDQILEHYGCQLWEIRIPSILLLG